jgi:DNA (cytosine-5)-methyltransferase 1
VTHIDLFSGIGGFALAARWAGLETVQFVEIDKFCQKVLAKQFPGVPIHDDIKTFKWTGERPFILTGGFPCQDLSSAGSRKGIYAERSGLWGELFTQMCRIRPKFTLIENVTGLLSGDSGQWFLRLLTEMAEGGFHVEWECVPASSVSAPHNRDRVYIVAYPSENGWLRIFAKASLTLKRNMGNNIGADWFGCGDGHWFGWQGENKKEILSEPFVVGEDDGLSRQMDRNSSLGNAIVPQVAYEIMKAIISANMLGES